MIGGDERVKVHIPNALTFCLMKLGALNDRAGDEDKSYGRHHALDLYRCIGMLTTREDEAAARIRSRHAGHESLRIGRERARALFAGVDGIGRLRMMEHELLPPEADVDRFVAELRYLLGDDDPR